MVSARSPANGFRNFATTTSLVAISLVPSLAFAQKAPAFLETFDDGAAVGWTSFGGTWSFPLPDANQSHHVFAVSSAQFEKSIVNVPPLADFEVEADLWLPAPTPDEMARGVQYAPATQASLLFCVANPRQGVDAYQGYAAGIDSAGTVFMGRSDNGWTPLASAPAKILTDMPYHVRVTKTGTHFRIALNGNVQFELDDAAWSSDCQRIGVRAGSSGTAWFDNVIVRPLGDPTLGAELHYKNPVSRYPVVRDPQLFDAGGKYYMVATTQPFFFHTNPGVRLWSSTNLVDWRFERLILDRTAINVAPGYRFWAPEIKGHGAKYFLTVNPSPVMLASAPALLGPYGMVNSNFWGGENDGDLLFDDDGRSYAYANSSGAEILNLDQGSIGPGQEVFPVGATGTWDPAGTGNEGPFVIKRNGRYIGFFSSWGRGYEVGVSYAEHPLGPWTKDPSNPVFGAESQAYCDMFHTPCDQSAVVPFKAAGHNAIFKGPDGRDWISAHAEGNNFHGTLLVMDPIWYENGHVRTTNEGALKSTGPTWTEQTVYLDPVARWPLASGSGGTATDVSPYGHACTLHGTTWGTNSLSFDGSVAYADCGPPTLLGPAHALTVAAWVRPDALTDGAGLVVGGRHSQPYVLAMMGDGTVAFEVNVGAQAGAAKFQSRATVAIASWHHVAVTSDGLQVSFYLDGKLDAALPANVILGGLTENVTLGADLAGPGHYYRGALSDVRIYARAVSDAEVATLAGTPPGAGPASSDEGSEVRAEVEAAVAGPVDVSLGPPPTNAAADANAAIDVDGDGGPQAALGGASCGCRVTTSRHRARDGRLLLLLSLAGTCWSQGRNHRRRRAGARKQIRLTI